MKKIALVTNYPFPDTRATANRIASFADAIQKIDAIELVIFSQSGRRQSVSNRYKISTCDAVSYSKKNLFKRAIGEFSQVFCIYKEIAKFKPDIVISTIPSPILLMSPYWFKKSIHIIDIRDAVWVYLRHRGYWSRIISYFLEWFARKSFMRAYAITTTNAYEKENILNIYKGSRVIVVSNGISLDRFSVLSEHFSVGEKRVFMEDGRLRIIYAGNIGFAQNLESLVTLAVKNDWVDILLIGEGGDKSRLETLANQNKIKNIKFSGLMEWVDLIEKYKDCDMVYGQIGAEYLSAVPSKIFEYVLLGKPVLFALPHGPARTILGEFKNVWIINEGSFEDLYSALNDIKNISHASKEDLFFNQTLIREKYIREERVIPLVEMIREIAPLHHNLLSKLVS